MSAHELGLGALFAGVVALAAWRAHALTRGGALAAIAVGALTFASGSAGFALVLLAFFVPSVLLSRLGRARKKALVDIAKGGARDVAQVLANGGVATACALVWVVTHDPRWAVAFAGAYAAAAADTWATEIGTLAQQPPRSILTLRPIAPGLSGGITLPGTLAEVAGALWLGVAGVAGLTVTGVFRPWLAGISSYGGSVAESVIVPAIAIALGGLAGASLDSLLGATVQELRHCARCGRACETDPHACGAPTRRIRGIPGFSNDAVNALATLGGAAVAFALEACARS